MEVKGSSEAVAIVTGASSGIGEAVALRLLKQGWRVFGASPEDSGAITFPTFHHIALDVTDDLAVRRAVAEVASRAGRIDALVNNAGFSLVGALEDTSDEEVFKQINVNLMGPWRMARAVIPIMRKHGSSGHGRIVQIGSIGGSVGLPYQAAYCASKFGVLGMCEALSAELADSGISVTVVEPGNVCSPIGRHRIRVHGANDLSAHAVRFERALSIIERDEENGWSVDAMSKVVVQAVIAEYPPLVVRAGPLMERLAPLAKALLPSRFFERLLIASYR